MRFLGIDLGTTFLKGAVLDLDARSFGAVRRVPVPAPLSGLPPTRCELDPLAVVAAVRTLLRELLREAPEASGLVMCSQMHGLVFTDEQGNPHSNAITWQDQRAIEATTRGTGSVFDELTRLVTPAEQEAIGRELRVGVPITALHWLRERGMLPAKSFAASLPDFVLANLCGVEPATDSTNAAAHGLLDLDHHDWHHGLIAKLGLGSLRWPRIRPFGEVIGVTRIDGHALTCYTPVGDQQCALAGTGLASGEMSLNISTGSQVSLLSRTRPVGEFQVRPYFDGQWLRTIVQVPAGRSLALLVELLTEMGTPADPWGYIARAVEEVGEPDLDVDLGFFGNVGGGRIAGIRGVNLTVGHLFAAAFRSMAANYAHCTAVIAPGHEWERVAFSGGIAQRFPRLRREVLAALGIPPHRLCPTEEDTLQGLLTLALVCAGRAATVEEAGHMLAHQQ